MSIRTALALLCLIAPACGRAQAGERAPDWSALLRGEVVVEALENRDGLPGLRAAFAVHAPRPRIWAALVDYEHFTQMFPDIERMQVLEEDASGARVEFWVDAVLRKVHYVLDRRYERPGERLSWKRESGDLERIEGSWEIRETPSAGVQLLVYEGAVQVGGIVPTSLVRWGAMRKARQMSERLRSWIERAPDAAPPR